MGGGGYIHASSCKTLTAQNRDENGNKRNCEGTLCYKNKLYELKIDFSSHLGKKGKSRQPAILCAFRFFASILNEMKQIIYQYFNSKTGALGV